jgi:Protein of unknown function (DUF1064)
LRRWTLADVVAARERLGLPAVEAPARPKIPKYRNQTAVYNGRRYGSKLEARYAAHLDLLWHAGEIRFYVTQTPFLLEGGIIYRADFFVVLKDGIEVVDATGVFTSVKNNKLKMIRERYNIVVLLYRKDGSLVPFTDVPVTRTARKILGQGQ